MPMSCSRLRSQFTAPAAGTYYVGISGYANTTYDPTTAGSGTAAILLTIDVTVTLG